MEDSSEYDNLLRSVFNSCDQNGNGYLTPYEFEDLCSQLCLEEQQTLLRSVLFKETSKLGYEQFKKVLLLLLDGSLSEPRSEDHDIEPRVNEDLISFDQEPKREKNTFETVSANNQNSYYDKTVSQALHRDCIMTSDSLSQPQVVQPDQCSSDLLLIDFEDQTKRGFNQENTFSDTVGGWAAPNLSPIKKYGRRSSPEESFKQKNNCSSNVVNLPHTPSPVEHMNTSASEVAAEEYTAEGDGGEWVVPDQDISMVDEREVSFMNSEAADDAQEALAGVWFQAVGSFEKKINLSIFQDLFLTQAPHTSLGEVEKLFEVLDDDKDGLITFADFSMQMSAFMTSADENQSPKEQNVHALHKHQQDDVLSMHETSHTANTCPHSTKKPDGIFKRDSIATSDSIHIRSSTQVSLKGENDVTMTSQARNEIGSISAISAIDSIVNEADEGMQRYHGVPPYRRRRRSTQPSIRQQRRRSSRIQSLPYYHPISRMNVEECPLYFLAEKNENYVLSEKIGNILTDEGINDTDAVFQELGLGLSHSLNVEILAEAFETELKENPVHYALCVLYKNGMNYYKSEKDQEGFEKRKLEAMLKLLDSQIEEQEERIEKLETEYREKIEATESRYKNKLERLKIKLETQQIKQEYLAADENKDLKNQFENLKTSHKQLQEELNLKESERIELSRTYLELEKQLDEAKDQLEHELNTKKSEHFELTQTCSLLESQLEESKSDLNSLRSKFDHVYDQTLLHKRSQVEQQRKMDQMLEDYKAESLKLQDQNDQLLKEMESYSNQWRESTLREPGTEQVVSEPQSTGFNEDASKATTCSQSTNFSTKISISPITKVTSSNSKRYVNRISFTPSEKSSFSSTPKKSNENEESKPSKKSRVSTFVISSPNLSENRRKFVS